MGTVRISDIGYFLAELGVYIAIVWWALTRDVAQPLRWVLALTTLVVFAGSWGLFAAPRATHPLSGSPDFIFRCAWFGAGLAAAAIVIVGVVRSA